MWGGGGRCSGMILELLTLCCFSERMLQRRGKQSNHTLSARAVSMWHSWAVANRNWTVLVDRIDSITLDWRMIRCARAALRVRLVACSSPFWSTVPTLWRSISRSSYKHHNKQSNILHTIPLRILGLTQLLTDEYQGYLLGGKVGWCKGLTSLPPSSAKCIAILGASTSWSPNGLPRPVTGWP